MQSPLVDDLVQRIAALPIRYFECTNTFDGYVQSTVGRRLGVEHLAWLLSQDHPAAIASSRARGAWDANQLGNLAAYKAVEQALVEGLT